MSEVPLYAGAVHVQDRRPRGRVPLRPRARMQVLISQNRLIEWFYKGKSPTDRQLEIHKQIVKQPFDGFAGELTV